MCVHHEVSALQLHQRAARQHYISARSARATRAERATLKFMLIMLYDITSQHFISARAFKHHASHASHASQARAKLKCTSFITHEVHSSGLLHIHSTSTSALARQSFCVHTYMHFTPLRFIYTYMRLTPLRSIHTYSTSRPCAPALHHTFSSTSSPCAAALHPALQAHALQRFTQPVPYFTLP